MRKNLGLPFIFFTIYLLFFIFNPVFAFDNSLPNNKFGIHLAQPHLEDLKAAKELVNSNGGDWGYVTLVIQENDRNREKWQEIFDTMRSSHLIPIIRIATKPEGAMWRSPVKEDADSWVDFLNSLNWVVKDRYVILFNEPNHSAEWGGQVDAINYSEIAKTFAEKLKLRNSDFFIILAGLDASAPQSLPVYEDEYSFLNKVVSNLTIKQFNNLFSGLSSHSYPNPAFAGSPVGFGRGTVRTYLWEKEVLKNLGVKDLLVFITETGWRRGDENIVAENFRIAYEQVWLPNNDVIAITPFVLDYQGEPFLQFSWKLPSAEATEEQEFYQQYYTVQSLDKIKGTPEQKEAGELNLNLPRELVSSSSYKFSIKLKNLGQAVWDKEFGYQLSVIGGVEYLFTDIKNLKPFEEASVDIFIKTNKVLEKNKLKISLQKDGKNILEAANPWEFNVLPLPKLTYKVGLFPKFLTMGNDFEIQIFDENKQLVFKKSGLSIKNIGTLEEVQNIALGRKYRIVLQKSYYLPRQNYFVFKKNNNFMEFKTMFPLDFDKNGTFDKDDITTLIKNPKLISLFFP